MRNKECMKHFNVYTLTLLKLYAKGVNRSKLENFTSENEDISNQKGRGNS